MPVSKLRSDYLVPSAGVGFVRYDKLSDDYTQNAPEPSVAQTVYYRTYHRGLYNSAIPSVFIHSFSGTGGGTVGAEEGSINETIPDYNPNVAYGVGNEVKYPITGTKWKCIQNHDGQKIPHENVGTYWIEYGVVDEAKIVDMSYSSSYSIANKALRVDISGLNDQYDNTSGNMSIYNYGPSSFFAFEGMTAGKVEVRLYGVAIAPDYYTLEFNTDNTDRFYIYWNPDVDVIINAEVYFKPKVDAGDRIVGNVTVGNMIVGRFNPIGDASAQDYGLTLEGVDMRRILKTKNEIVNGEEFTSMDSYRSQLKFDVVTKTNSAFEFTQHMLNTASIQNAVLFSGDNTFTEYFSSGYIESSSPRLNSAHKKFSVSCIGNSYSPKRFIATQTMSGDTAQAPADYDLLTTRNTWLLPQINSRTYPTFGANVEIDFLKSSDFEVVATPSTDFNIDNPIMDSIIVTVSNAIEGATYSTTINDTEYSYVALATDSTVTISTDLVSQINADVSAVVTASNNADGTFTVSADVSGTPFTITQSDNMSNNVQGQSGRIILNLNDAIPTWSSYWNFGSFAKPTVSLGIISIEYYVNELVHGGITCQFFDDQTKSRNMFDKPQIPNRAYYSGGDIYVDLDSGSDYEITLSSGEWTIKNPFFNWVVLEVTDVQNSTTYTTTINGTAINYTSSTSATAYEIALNLSLLITASAEPVTALVISDTAYAIYPNVGDTPFTVINDQRQRNNAQGQEGYFILSITDTAPLWDTYFDFGSYGIPKNASGSLVVHYHINELDTGGIKCSYEFATAKTDRPNNWTAGQAGETINANTGAIDFDLAQHFRVEPTANVTIANPTITADQVGQEGLLVANGTTYTVSWGTYWNFGTGGAPTLTGWGVFAYHVEATDKIIIRQVAD